MKYAVILLIVFSLVSCSKKVAKVIEQPYKDAPIMTYEPEPVKELEPPSEPPEIVKTEVKKTVIVFFDFDSWDIRESEKYKLNEVDKSAEVTGGACEIGTYEYNFDLGLKRAKSVRDYLEMKGVTVVEIGSVGEEDPISEINEMNRRCEIKY